jgi:hypothetical protein
VCALRQASVGLCRKLEKRILRLHKDGMGVLKIGKTLGVGTAWFRGLSALSKQAPHEVPPAGEAAAWRSRAVMSSFASFDRSSAVMAGTARFGARSSSGR